MTAITEISETVDQCKPGCTCKNVCPPNCTYKDGSFNRALTIIINAIGILVAIIATYMLATTDSNLYLIFWICYSVLRRMMVKNKITKSEKLA